MNHYWEVTKHKALVFGYCLRFCFRLMRNCWKHDNSKYSKIEAKGFIEHTDKLSNVSYGSEEYKKCLDGLKQSLEHHYAVNSHHPEHYVVGFYNMTALDRLELIFDWMASTRRMKDGDINKSLEINQTRFKYTDADTEWLKKIVKDTKR